MTEATIVPIIIQDVHGLESMREMLRTNNLPSDDLKLENSLFISYDDGNGKMIGSGGLEFYSRYALLRSIAVNESKRSRSIGSQIVTDLVRRAREKSVSEIYLLTETAHDFFERRGFTDVSRELVPDEVRAASEFTTACPASAACMVYRLSVE